MIWYYMNTGAISNLLDVFDPIRLIGPIFDKELRVSSRRRRNYLLRFTYVVVLSVFVLSAWYSYTGGGSPAGLVYRMSRLSVTARRTISTIVWFQFVTAQLVAIIMLGSSISDEIRSGTLGVLMTTPINSFQIVTGKLLSKLLQVMLLLAISLPFLAIVRVFGGVPWDYVASSVCITLTATLLAGALSLLLSITYRYGYTVILVTVGIYLLLFGAITGLNMLAAKGLFILDGQATQSLLALTNPFVALAAVNAKFLQSGAPSFSWPLHCLLMLAATTVLIAVGVWRIRRAATDSTFGTTTKVRSVSFLEPILARIFYRAGSRSSPTAMVTGSPIVWKEMRKGFVGRSKGEAAVFVLLTVAFLVAVVLLLLSGGMRTPFLPSYFMSAFCLIALVRMAIFSAGGITAEKEARTWPVLLTTPLDDKDIVRGKAIAAFRRNVPLLLMYFILFCIFYLRMAQISGVGASSILFIAFSLVPLASSILFVIGSGLYFGTRFRTTTGAVAATIGLHLVVTYLFCGWFNPLNRFFLVRLLSRGGGQWLYFGMTILRCLTIAGIGLSLARSARRRLRRDIF